MNFSSVTSDEGSSALRGDVHMSRTIVVCILTRHRQKHLEEVHASYTSPSIVRRDTARRVNVMGQTSTVRTRR
jgi:hypothetical protein